MILDENWSRGIIKKSGFFSSTKPLQDSHQTTPRKKNIYIKLFSQARYKPDTPPNPFVCCENNHTLTSLFKAHRRAWERSKGTTVMWVSSGQHHFPWLKQAKAPQTPWAHRQSSSWCPLTDHLLLLTEEFLPATTRFWGLGSSCRHEQEDNNCLRLLWESTSSEDRHESDLPSSAFLKQAETKPEEELCIILLAQRQRTTGKHDKNLTPK